MCSLEDEDLRCHKVFVISLLICSSWNSVNIFPDLFIFFRAKNDRNATKKKKVISVTEMLQWYAQGWVSCKQDREKNKQANSKQSDQINIFCSLEHFRISCVISGVNEYLLELKKREPWSRSDLLLSLITELRMW